MNILDSTEQFFNSDIYKNWRMYHDRYKHALSKKDIQDIKEQIESISHEIEGARYHEGRFGPLFIIEKLYRIQKCIAKNNHS
jgi:hypothetical protein